jgi:uncharacterized membrane protein (DUF4010 family)
MSFLLLPFLPRRTIDPWGAINPHEIWLLAILIAAISFGGYMAVRIFGERYGVLMTAMMGGLASSTVTTLTFARLEREHPDSSRLLSAGILIAGMVMVVRVGVVAVALNDALLAKVAGPLGVTAAVLGLASIILLFGTPKREAPQLKIDNPLALGSALKLAAFIAAVMLAAQSLHWAFGSLGVLVVAGVSGIADVDAATISIIRMTSDKIDLVTAGQGILIAVAVNTLSKAIMTCWVGTWRTGVPVAGISAAALACGGAAAWWTV